MPIHHNLIDLNYANSERDSLVVKLSRSEFAYSQTLEKSVTLSPNPPRSTQEHEMSQCYFLHQFNCCLQGFVLSSTEKMAGRKKAQFQRSVQYKEVSIAEKCPIASIQSRQNKRKRLPQ